MKEIGEELQGLGIPRTKFFRRDIANRNILLQGLNSRLSYFIGATAAMSVLHIYEAQHENPSPRRANKLALAYALEQQNVSLDELSAAAVAAHACYHHSDGPYTLAAAAAHAAARNAGGESILSSSLCAAFAYGDRAAFEHGFESFLTLFIQPKSKWAQVWKPNDDSRGVIEELLDNLINAGFDWLTAIEVLADTIEDRGELFDRSFLNLMRGLRHCPFLLAALRQGGWRFFWFLRVNTDEC